MLAAAVASDSESPTGLAQTSDMLAVRRNAAASQLADCVAALERIRLDLLRLHAGAVDLAPLTTLLDAARELGDDANRLAEAQREVNDALGSRPLGGERTPTPA